MQICADRPLLKVAGLHAPEQSTAKATQALQTPDTQATLLESSCGMCMLCLRELTIGLQITQPKGCKVLCQERSCTAPQLTAITVACLLAHINGGVMLHR